MSSVVRSWGAATWLSARGASGELAEGLEMALVRSMRLVRMRSLDEARGMVTFVGNHEMVSQIRSMRVSLIQTRWQRYESRAGPVYHPSRAWGRPGGASGWFFVHEHANARRIKQPVKLGPSGELWMEAGAAKQVQGDEGLGHKVIPQVQREVFDDAA